MYQCKCKYNHESVSVEAGEVLLIAAKCTDGVCDKEEFNFRLRECLPASVSAPLQVYIIVNGENAAVLDRYGNYVYSNQIKPRKVYRGRYGDNPAHVIFYNEGDDWGGCAK